MTPEQERWGEASMVLAQHGDGVFTFIAKRIIALARQGDEAGVTRWREIERHVTRMIRGTVQ